MNSSVDPAELFEEVARELDQAAAHARTAARHFREGEIPRMAAHAWAAQGHLHAGQSRLATQSRQHSEHSQP